MHPSVEKYIEQFPEEIQVRLHKIYEVIQKNAPDAVDDISYGIPTFKQNGNLVHFGGFKKHIGFFPTAKGIETFKTALKKFPTSKGTVQFLHENPLPLALIAKIVKYRVKEVESKQVKKREKTTC